MEGGGRERVSEVGKKERGISNKERKGNWEGGEEKTGGKRERGKNYDKTNRSLF